MPTQPSSYQLDGSPCESLNVVKIFTTKFPENMVLRVPVLYGPVEYLEESAVTTLLQTITDKDKKPAKVSDYEVRLPRLTNSTDCLENAGPIPHLRRSSQCGYGNIGRFTVSRRPK